MKKRNRETIEIWTGTAAFAVIAIWFGWSYFASSGPPRDGYQITAQYRNVDGITRGSDVLMAGIPVGVVTGISYDGARSKAVMELTIRDHVKIPTDSAAKIVSESMLGSKYVKIEPGGNDAVFKPGDRFQFVQNSVVIEEVLRRLITEVEAGRAARKAKKKATE